MSHGHDGDDGDDERGGFADLFGADPETRRLGSRQRAPAPPRPGRRRARDLEATPPATPDDEPHEAGEPYRGDVPPREFAALRRGDTRVESRIDLHGLDRGQARATLRKSFGVASAAGRACVLVIHGRGRGSRDGETTLRDALPGWLRSPPLDAWVRGFAPALPRDGGEGATYVLLRRHAQMGGEGRLR